jgi:hypothetical protein
MVNVFSQYKGHSNKSGKRYTIPGKSYIIHTYLQEDGGWKTECDNLWHLTRSQKTETTDELTIQLSKGSPPISPAVKKIQNDQNNANNDQCMNNR